MCSPGTSPNLPEAAKNVWYVWYIMIHDDSWFMIWYVWFVLGRKLWEQGSVWRYLFVVLFFAFSPRAGYLPALMNMYWNPSEHVPSQHIPANCLHCQTEVGWQTWQTQKSKIGVRDDCKSFRNLRTLTISDSDAAELCKMWDDLDRLIDLKIDLVPSVCLGCNLGTSVETSTHLQCRRSPCPETRPYQSATRWKQQLHLLNATTGIDGSYPISNIDQQSLQSAESTFVQGRGQPKTPSEATAGFVQSTPCRLQTASPKEFKDRFLFVLHWSEARTRQITRP